MNLELFIGAYENFELFSPIYEKYLRTFVKLRFISILIEIIIIV